MAGYGLIRDGLAWNGVAWTDRTYNTFNYILCPHPLQNTLINGLLVGQRAVLWLHLDEHEVLDLTVVYLKHQKIWCPASQNFPSIVFILLDDLLLRLIDHLSHLYVPMAGWARCVNQLTFVVPNVSAFWTLYFQVFPILVFVIVFK